MKVELTKILNSSDDLSRVQVALLDVNETEGKNLSENLNKQYGQERTLFLSCNVESEEQIKGNTKTVKLDKQNMENGRSTIERKTAAL